MCERTFKGLEINLWKKLNLKMEGSQVGGDTEIISALHLLVR
jgi:hypothetical protein